VSAPRLRHRYNHREAPEENVNIAGRAELAANVKQIEAQLLAGMGRPE
jgi:hypothetical protein